MKVVKRIRRVYGAKGRQKRVCEEIRGHGVLLLLLPLLLLLLVPIHLLV